MQPAGTDRQVPASEVGHFSEVRALFTKTITEIEPFFRGFVTKGHPSSRDQFETQEQYEARLPKPIDQATVFYFSVERAANFKYDIDRQRLLVTGGEIKDPGYREYKYDSAIPLMIFYRSEEKDKYEASNAYGKTVTVTKDYFYECFLHLTNGKKLNQKLRTKGMEDYSVVESLGLSFPIATADAKELAPNLALVVGVRFSDYKRSISECTLYSKATIQRPAELSVFCTGIDAELVSVHVIDKRTKQEYASWTK